MGLGKVENIVSYVASGLGVATATLLDNPVAQWTLLSLSILSALIGVVSRIVAIIRDRKQDGKIDLKDIQDIIDEAKDAVEDAKDDVKGDKE